MASSQVEVPSGARALYIGEIVRIPRRFVQWCLMLEAVILLAICAYLSRPKVVPQFVVVAGVPSEELPRLQRLLAHHRIVSQQGDISGRGGTPIQVESTQRETARRLLAEDAYRRRYHIALPQ